jgi:translation initiation factor 6
MHLLKTNFNGNPNVGLYGYCTNSYCLVGMEVPESKLHHIREALKVSVHRITLCGTSLIGVFAAGNSNMLLLPEIAFDYELKRLDHLGIRHKVIHTHLTALGNNLLCNDKGCVASPEFNAETLKMIGHALGVEVKTGRIAGLETVGSLAALNSRGCAAHRDVTRTEKSHIQRILGVKCHESTVNMGSPYIRSGLLCNDHGFIIGDWSSGPEIVNIEEELGYLKERTAGKTRMRKAAKTQKDY